MPGIAASGALMEGGHGRGNGEPRDFGESGGSGSDFFQGGFFGFVSNIKAGEIGIRGKFLGAAFFQKVIGKFGVVGSDGGPDDGMVGLESLNNDFGFIEVAAADATDDLSEELERALFGRKIRERKTAVGLDDADGGKVGKIKPSGESLRADENVDFAGFNLGIETSKILVFFIIAVEASDGGFRKKIF